MILRTGFTTGTCAAAAAKAAAILLCEGISPESVEIALPEGQRIVFSVVRCERSADGARATVCKDAGDDPDVTHQALINVEVVFIDGNEVKFASGEGVGTVTKPGLSIAPGEPAINPAPRRMIPGGRELAARTFNPRLGIEGGLSIIGTTGIVKPFSAPALTASLQCALDVAAASGVLAPVLVPGNIGERAAQKNFRLERGQTVQVSNHWGFMLDQVAKEPRFEQLLVCGHPGKLAKMVDGEWDTHSSNSASATGIVARIAEKEFGRSLPECATVEGIFEACEAADSQRLGNVLAATVRDAIATRISMGKPLSVVLINMAGEVLGAEGDLSSWK